MADSQERRTRVSHTYMPESQTGSNLDGFDIAADMTETQTNIPLSSNATSYGTGLTDSLFPSSLTYIPPNPMPLNSQSTNRNNGFTANATSGQSLPGFPWPELLDTTTTHMGELNFEDSQEAAPIVNVSNDLPVSSALSATEGDTNDDYMSSNYHPVLNVLEEGAGLEAVTQSELDEIPDALMFTQLPDEVFDTDRGKDDFECTLRQYDPMMSAYYLKNFHRARVQLSSASVAAAIKVSLDGATLYGSTIGVFFIKTNASSCTDPSNTHLKPPPLEKQFLISPPASPPVGWAPSREAHPVINYDLLRAVTDMKPGEAHVIHPGSDTYPAVVVHIAEDAPMPTIITPPDDDDADSMGPGPRRAPKPTIIHTRCPARQQQ